MYTYICKVCSDPEDPEPQTECEVVMEQQCEDVVEEVCCHVTRVTHNVVTCHDHVTCDVWRCCHM